MAFEVDKKTLLFTNALTWEEARELAKFAERIVIEGYVDGDHPAFKAWSTVAEYDSRQKLLVYSTAFPQRALLSLVRLLSPKMPGVEPLLDKDTTPGGR